MRLGAVLATEWGKPGVATHFRCPDFFRPVKSLYRCHGEARLPQYCRGYGERGGVWQSRMLLPTDGAYVANERLSSQLD
ncbi:MAG: hypothetical protein ACLVEJ_12790 [Parabacteroides sp.]